MKGAAGELISQGRLGLSMMMKKRMHFGSEKIKNISEVERIYKKSKDR